MARSKLKPVSIAGIEADALIDESINYSSDIPKYPVEDGNSVSDTIILKPITVNMTLFISDTPVTWRGRKGHKPQAGRTKKICNKFERLYFSKKLVKVVTTDKIYTNMGIASMSISHSKELGYARQISLTLEKVYITKRKTTKIPSYILQSGETKANAGKATTSTVSSNSSSSGMVSNSVSSSSSGSSGTGGSTSTKSNASSGTKNSDSTKKSSILYGFASKAGFI